MRFSLAIALLLGSYGYATAQADKDKPHTLSAGSLQIDGEVASDDPKLKVTDPQTNVALPLRAKLFKVTLPAGKYQIEIKSTAIDPVLVVQDKTGRQLAFDDDGGEGLNSRLTFQAAKTDTYTLVAAAYKGTGAFALTVKTVGDAAAKTGDAADVPKDGLNVEGNITAAGGSVSLPFGMMKKDFAGKNHIVKLAIGKKYQMDLVKQEPDSNLDPLLILLDDKGELAGIDDDGGGELNSRLLYQSVAAGEHKVGAAALTGEGKYRLTIKEVPLSKEETAVHEIGADGVKFDGSITREQRSVVYRLKLERGKRYVIEMTAADQKKLDCFLKLYSSDGKLVAEDDDGGGGLNSRINLQAPGTGVFFLRAQPLFLLGAGDFTLQVRAGNKLAASRAADTVW